MVCKHFWRGLTVVVALSGAAWAMTNSPPVVSDVSATQRQNSSLVDIYYDLADADGDLCVVYARVSTDGGATWDIKVKHIVEGDAGPNIEPGTGKHIVWDCMQDAPGLAGNFTVRVFADDGHHLIEMCLVPDEGTFTTSTGVAVRLSTYWIGKYEITNAEWCMFLNSGGKDAYYRQTTEISRTGTPGSYKYLPVAGCERRPVAYVNWYDATAFCDWLSQLEGAPAGTYRLPTDAEWQKAGAWDPVQKKLWTYCFQSDTIDASKCNYNSSVGHTTDVGAYDPWKSYYGCYDMSGNLWEWCQDWTGGTYPSSTTDPTGPASGTVKLLRGGGFTNTSGDCRSGYRYDGNPSYSYSYLGFRCARTCQ